MNTKNVEEILIENTQLSLRNITMFLDEDQREVELILNELVDLRKVSRGEEGSECSAGCTCTGDKFETCCSAPDMIYRWRG